jgi:long-chain acyl-CoA synthetase
MSSKLPNTTYNDTSLGQYPSPLEKFYHNEKTLAERTCFVQPHAGGRVEEFSWSQHADQVRRMAAHLKSLSLEPGSRIALMSNNCAHWIMADFAIWMAGHISVPLYPVLSANSIQQILEHSESKVLFVGKLDGWEAMSAGVSDDIRTISMPLAPSSAATTERWNDIISITDPMRENPIPPNDNVATIVYTSGTTGMPKGVMHSFATLATVGTLTGKLYSTNQNDRMLSYLPLAHVAERAAVEINQLYQEFPVYFSGSLETFADDLRRAQPTLFFAVPRIWVKLQQRVLEQIPAKKLDRLLKLPIISGIVRRKLTKALGMNKVRIGVSGAAPLSTSLMSWYQSLGITILEGYAMSENFAYSHSTQLGEAKIGYVGNANPFVDCKLSDEGEILIKSPTNMLGYYLQPELSAETIDADGYLHTGDKGVIDQSGRLKITGRFKEIFKTSKGKYVAPAPIEDLLLRNTALEQVCVTGADLPQPIALATLSEAAVKQSADSTFKNELLQSLAELIKDTNSKLDKHENISTLVLFNELWSVDNNFMTPTLKVKRAQLEEAHQGKFTAWSDSKELLFWEGGAT